MAALKGEGETEDRPQRSVTPELGQDKKTLKHGVMFQTEISLLFSAGVGHRFKEAATSHSNVSLWIQRGPAQHLSTGHLISCEHPQSMQ